MSLKTCCKILFICTIVVCAAAAMAQVAPTSLFQLDGNAASTPLNTCTYGALTNQLCDYWNLLNGTGSPVDANGFGAGSSAGSSLTRVYIDGTLVTNVLSQGSKDTNNTTTWAWSGNSSPNKDTFDAGYAAAYQQNGDLVLMFGANRVSPNGDANVGIWFFQNDVEKQANGTFGPGAHKDGDVFIVSAFTNGGGTSGVTAYAWDHALCGGVKTTVKSPKLGGCADTNLAFLGSAAASSVCGSSIFCAITNTNTTNSSWNSALASPLFFEGGVDITAAFVAAKLTAPSCFSSFIEETRSSQSTGAELKDFLGGSFKLCGVSITKQCDSASIATTGATTYNFSGTVTNKGVGALYNVVVTDSYPPGATNSSLTLATLPDSCSGTPCLLPTHTVGYTGSFDLGSTNNTVVNQVSVTAGATSTTSTDVSDGPNSWPLQADGTLPSQCKPSPQSALVVTKSCTTSVTSPGGVLSVMVNFSGTVSNPTVNPVTGGTDNVEVDGIKLCDAEGSVTCDSTAGEGQVTSITVGGKSVAQGFSLTPGQTANYSGSYTPTSFSCNDAAGTGVCTFTDNLFASGTGADGSGTQNGSAGATCHLCPAGVCPASGN